MKEEKMIMKSIRPRTRLAWNTAIEKSLTDSYNLPALPFSMSWRLRIILVTCFVSLNIAMRIYYGHTSQNVLVQDVFSVVLRGHKLRVWGIFCMGVQSHLPLQQASDIVESIPVFSRELVIRGIGKKISGGVDKLV